MAAIAHFNVFVPHQDRLPYFRDGARITLHCAAGKCGASTLACRVGTPADARCLGPAEASFETRRGTQKCVRHDSRCEVILALPLSRSPADHLPDGVPPVVSSIP